jgi:hypothetical protein
MPRIPIIGIAGPARSGKDTTASLIAGLVGGYHYSFADPIRAMLKAGLRIDMSQPYWQEHKESPIAAFGGKSPRQMMQWLGTEWGRNLIDQDIWITLAKQTLLNSGAGMIVADVRFENEAQMIREMNGLLIHLRRAAAPPVHGHASEMGVAITEDDVVIHNDGTLEDLQARLRSVLKA